MTRPVPSLPPPSKKRKIQKDSEFVKSVERLEERLTSAAAANGSLNPLADLLDLAFTAGDAQDTSKAIYALYRVFVIVVSGGKLGPGGDEAAKVVKSWIWERLNSYVDFLCGLLKDEEKLLRISALQILFSLQKHLSTSASLSDSQPQFHISHFRKIVSGLLLCPPSGRTTQRNEGVLDPDVLHLFHETWFSVHDDVRWFFLREAGSLINTTSTSTHPNLPANLLTILEGLNTFPTEKAELNAWWVVEMGSKPPKPKPSKKGAVSAEDLSSDEEEAADKGEDDDDWRKFFDEDTASSDANKSKTPAARLHKLTIHQSLHSLPSHRAVFTRAWLALLPKLSVGHDVVTSRALALRALNVMHRGVMPHLTRPVLVMDWVGGSVDHGGTVGLLALNALFVLMKEYNLDYPSFYTKLYAFLDRDVLHSKHRARFFRLTELFLSSTHIPATMLASFIKRLARLSLSAPPAAIIMIIPFTYNTLKRHPALMAMIHRPTDGDADAAADPFDVDEPNPLLTRAIESSLWELNSHREHYLASASTLSKIFGEAFTKPGYAMEDFLDHTYGTLFDADADRKIKKEPAVAVDMGKQLDLFRGDEAEELGGDVVSELWSFSGK
ncbi:CBF/Mak21 family-domain-containing protein [Mycena latifolia]|nr:CBF/Mak21 family-domain-containing protein [Mycena latifolia]